MFDSSVCVSVCPSACLSVYLLVCLSVCLSVCGSDGSRVVRMDDRFFTGYRKTIMRPQELLLSIEIPYSKQVTTSLFAEPNPSPYSHLCCRFSSSDPVCLRLQTVASSGGWHQYHYHRDERHLHSWEWHCQGLEAKLRRHGGDHSAGQEDGAQTAGKVRKTDHTCKWEAKWGLQ